MTVSTILMSRLPVRLPPDVVKMSLDITRSMTVSISAAVKASLGSGRVIVKELPAVVSKTRRRFFVVVIAILSNPFSDIT